MEDTLKKAIQQMKSGEEGIYKHTYFAVGGSTVLMAGRNCL